MKKLNLILLSFLLCSCQPHSLSECKKKGIALQMYMLDELRNIKSSNDLQIRQTKLEKLHIELIELIRRARYLQKKGHVSSYEDTFDISNELRDEILRICAIPGAREIFEKIQQEALYLIDHID